MYTLEYTTKKVSKKRREKAERIVNYLIEHKNKIEQYYTNLPDEKLLQKKKGLEAAIKWSKKYPLAPVNRIILIKSTLMFAAAWNKTSKEVEQNGRSQFIWKYLGMSDEEVADFKAQLLTLYQDVA
jgi:hypothetical protein